jgi:glycosyltransferase involved in cell wall biosynthesis
MCPRVSVSCMKLSILLPIYNEISTIAELLNRVWNAPLPQGMERELVIVESNSTDGTREIVKQFCDAKASVSPNTIKLILQERPRGKGNAIREAFQVATGDIILIQDGDLEYDVADYPALIQPILDDHADFVLGSRHMSAGHWKIRRFQGNHLKSFVFNVAGVFFHGLFNLLYGQELTDPTTMYKVFLRRCLTGIRFTSNHFDFDYELTGKLIRKGYAPLEVPVSYYSRSFAEGKKIRMFRDPPTWIWAMLKSRFCRLS